MHYAPDDTPIYLVDPRPNLESHGNLTVIEENASTGVRKACDIINVSLPNT